MNLVHLSLAQLRSDLIRQEETIIFALIERAQFRRNQRVYQPGGIELPQFTGSFLEYLLHRTEFLHAQVRRYTSPDEHPFCQNLPDPLLPPTPAPPRIRPNRINLNRQVRSVYEAELLPRLCAPGDCGNYGSSATCDVSCLQALSKRIHYGKFVAEAKFQAEEERYRALIAAHDRDGLMTALRKPEVEARLLDRVQRKAATYGQDLDDPDAPEPHYKIPPELVRDLYRDYIIPLTCEVEVLYLLERLEPCAT